MEALDRRIRMLRKLPPEERLAAVGAAFGLTPACEAEPLALLLIELASKSSPGRGLRGTRRGTAGLARTSAAAVLLLATRWRVVPPGLRQVALAAGRGRWAESLAALQPGQLAVHGEAIAELAIDSGDPALTGCLPPILALAESRAAAMAGQALLAIALRLSEPVHLGLLGLEETSPSLRPLLDAEAAPWTPAAVGELLAAVAAAVQGFENHGRKEVLLAALLLLESPRQTIGGGDALAVLVTDRDAPAGQTLRSAFRRAKAPIARQRAWLWLREEAVAAACTERIARAPTPADHAVLLALGHLAIAPARARHLAIVPIATRPAPSDQLPPGVPAGCRVHPTGPVPDRRTLAALPPACRRQVPRLVAALDADETTRAMALEPLLLEADPIARWNAAQVLVGGHARDYCFDRHALIAGHAALRACSLGVREAGRPRAADGPRRRFASGLARSPHPVVRAIGRAETDRLTPGGQNRLQLLAALRLHRATPEAFADWVRGRVESDDPSAGVAAMMVARRIGAVAAIEAVLLRLVAGSLATPAPGASRLAATAVASLGDLRSPRTESVLRECLRTHPDARVRANAAEALGRSRRPTTRDRLPAETAAETHHRVRASVLRAMLLPWPEPKGDRATDAAEALSAMLVDPRAEHRLAGVWVVQRSLRSGLEGELGRRWERLAGRVRWLADEDTDADVRTRATVVTTRLDAAIAGLGPKAMTIAGVEGEVNP